jgi:hypothetical protein
MKKRVISIMAIAALLVASIAVPCIADSEYTRTASVEVSEFISITITDNGTAGINFGTVAPGSTDNPDIDSITDNATIRITVNSESNTNVDIQIYGTDFIPGTFTIDNAKYSTTIDGTKYAMSTTNTTIIGGDDIAPGEYVDIWHWLDVPSSVPAVSHSSTFSYKAIAN